MRLAPPVTREMPDTAHVIAYTRVLPRSRSPMKWLVHSVLVGGRDGGTRRRRRQTGDDRQLALLNLNLGRNSAMWKWGDGGRHSQPGRAGKWHRSGRSVLEEVSEMDQLHSHL